MPFWFRNDCSNVFCRVTCYWLGKEWIKVPERNINKSDLAAGGEARIGFGIRKKDLLFFLTYSLTNNLQMIGFRCWVAFNLVNYFKYI